MYICIYVCVNGIAMMYGICNMGIYTHNQYTIPLNT